MTEYAMSLVYRYLCHPSPFEEYAGDADYLFPGWVSCVHDTLFDTEGIMMFWIFQNF
jgi:hypothetical protein